jgi:hypothetical protein
MRGAQQETAAALGAFAALAVTLIAFGDLPLLGTLFGAAASGAIAGLLAGSARGGARAAFLGGMAGVVLLLMLALSAAQPLPSRPVSRPSDVVIVTQMVLVGWAPAPVAAALGWVLRDPTAR